MRVFLEPADGWIFRANRSFGEGGDNHSESVFPPSPAVIAGALRTAILRQHDVDLDALKAGRRCLPERLEPFLGYAPGPGRDFAPGKFHIRETEVGLIQDSGKVEVLYEAPADLLSERMEPPAGGQRAVAREADGTAQREPCYGFLRPLDAGAATGPGRPAVSFAGAPRRIPWCSTLERPAAARGLLADSDWRRYLRGLPPEAPPRPVVELFHKDMRLGIGMSIERRTSETGKLYTTERIVAVDALSDSAPARYTRPGIVVDCPGLEEVLATPTLVRLGGDGLVARVNPASAAGPVPAAQPNAAGWFRLILRTPLQLGGDPSALRIESDGSVSLREGPLEARAVSWTGPALGYVGGFDLVLGAPKPSLRAVPRGTVFWMEIVKGDLEAFAQRFDRGSLHREGTAAWAEGFGLTAVGSWNGEGGHCDV